MAQRIKGLECTLALSTPDGADEEVFEDVLEANIDIDMEILEQAYLGQTAKKFDDIFNGISGSVKIHMETANYIRFCEKVQDRAERRTPADGVFSLSFTLNFPSGTKARLTAEDIYFGTLPLRFGKREDYIEGEINYKGSRLRRVL